MPVLRLSFFSPKHGVFSQGCIPVITIWQKPVVDAFSMFFITRLLADPYLCSVGQTQPTEQKHSEDVACLIERLANMFSSLSWSLCSKGNRRTCMTSPFKLPWSGRQFVHFVCVCSIVSSLFDSVLLWSWEPVGRRADWFPWSPPSERMGNLERELRFFLTSLICWAISWGQPSA